MKVVEMVMVGRGRRVFVLESGVLFRFLYFYGFGVF